MKILKFRKGDIDIFIPTEFIYEYHSKSENKTQIYFTYNKYKLPVNTEKLLKRIYAGNTNEFEIISIPFEDDDDFTLQNAMKYRV